MVGLNININVTAMKGMTPGIGSMPGASLLNAFTMLANLMTQFNSGLIGMSMGMGSMGMSSMSMGSMGMGSMGYGIGAPPFMNDFYGLMNTMNGTIPGLNSIAYGGPGMAIPYSGGIPGMNQIVYGGPGTAIPYPYGGIPGLNNIAYGGPGMTIPYP